MYIHSIVTAIPQYQYSQEFLRELMVARIQEGKKLRRYIQRIYNQSGIDKRHSVIADFANESGKSFFDWGLNEASKPPCTRERNEIYIRESKKLFIELARKTVHESPEIDPSDITHVITVSCTGFYSPGPDFHIVRELELPDSIERFHLGFMGCYAAFPAIRMANAFCKANTEAVVLVVCVELCTLHFQLSPELDNILAGSIFSDGGAAALITGKRLQKSRNAYKIRNFQTALIPSAEKEMSWIIGNSGFEILLTNSITEVLNANVPKMIDGFFEKIGF